MVIRWRSPRIQPVAALSTMVSSWSGRDPDEWLKPRGGHGVPHLVVRTPPGLARHRWEKG
jgi:hypothetical protein